MKTSENKAFGVLRIIFGFIWLIDAYFKWQPAFLNNFMSYLQEGAQGQPQALHWWFASWMQIVSINPHAFAVLVAIAETAIALALIFGVWVRGAFVGGIALAFLIWATAEGFGGPYVAGSTDIGTGIMYVFIFFVLWAGKSWHTYKLGGYLKQSKSSVGTNS